MPGCGSNDPGSPGPGDPPLLLLASYSLDFREPSGLTVDGAGTSLWVVGNRAQRIYRLSLDGQVQLTLEGWVSGEYANRIPSFAHLDDEAIAAVLTYHANSFRQSVEACQ